MMQRILFISLMLCTASAQAGSLADPTQPTPGGMGSISTPDNSSIKLNATYIGKFDRYAIINGVKLREGETLGNIRLQRIRHKSVDITADDHTRSLQLNNLIVKTQ